MVDKMKIPQRQDQVSLGAPQTQAGRAVRPVEGSLGDSYLTAMQGMAKSMKDLSDLQFDLGKNAIEGQLNSFDIYVQARTKQYNNELSLATSQEDINKLFEQYNKDIDTNGTAKLGVELFDNWKKAKGGNTIAGAEYAGNLASAQLQIKLNGEMLTDSLQELNVLAGQSMDAKERTGYIKQAHELIDNNVKNGTINEAQAQSKKRKFDYDLASSLVMKDMERDPEYVANALRTNSKYMPELPNPERMRLAQQADEAAVRRAGTGASKINQYLKDVWIKLYSSDKFTKTDDGKDVNMEREFAYRVYDSSTEKPLETAKEFARQIGLDPDLIHADDAIAFRTFMLQAFDFNDQNRNDAYNKAYNEAKETVNTLTSYKTDKDKIAKSNPLTFILNFRDKDFYKVDRDSIDTFISAYNNANSIMKDSYSRALAAKSGGREVLEEQNNLIADVIVSDIEKPYFEKEGYYGRMRDRLKEAEKRLEDSGTLYGDKQRKMRRMVRYLMDNNDVVSLFNGQQDETKVALALEDAFMYAMKPENDFEKIAVVRVAHGLDYKGSVQERVNKLNKELGK